MGALYDIWHQQGEIRRVHSPLLLAQAFFRLAVALTPPALMVLPAAAQQYPVRPVRIIAPFPAGGGVDLVARTVGEKLAGRLGQSIVVDNRPGAAATLGTSLAAKTTPDGYTLLVAPVIGLAIAQAYYRKLDFDLARDFAPVTKIGFGTVVMVVPPSLGVTSVKEFVAHARANAGKITYASSGVGGLIHLTGELFKQMAGVEMLHVPYKGTTQLLPDLVDGRVSIAIDSLPAHLPHIKAGRLRALGVARKTRSPQLPDVPTIGEAGVPGFESYTDYALYAPLGTPRGIVALLNKHVGVVLQLADVRAKLEAIGIELAGSTPEALQREVVDEIAKWTKVIRDAKITRE
ncbi:MAG: tripartite tricarboxylate transporter substrate binding protein [Betaproteobacteria bacterium]|nr:tripartite tricarboxylate transporter substrate binding protein [Betaproteobacteria bacterium]